MTRTFRRVAIINRGEPAMRFVHAARELSAEGIPLTTIAFFTDPDRHALFVRDADEAVPLGPPTFVDRRDARRKPSYLDLDRLERALAACRAEAVWAGWGFVAEQIEFVERCEALGIVFIGPGAGVMRRLGDKISAKRLAEANGVPVTPWSGGPVNSAADARQWVARLGLPLMIKATAGGGGRGIRVVAEVQELEDALQSARSEAAMAFGDSTVYLERLVEGARHVEVQVIADVEGTAWALGVRDCSIQRRNQKVIEETPSPVLSRAEDAALCESALLLCRAAGYVNAGTVEFLIDRERRPHFMEVNARLQVEHPVTELVSGLDLVKLQVKIAQGQPLPGARPSLRGHAIEVRLTAEDVDAGFTPAPGIVEALRVPCGPGVRVDTGVAEGDLIPREFDSMIAKVIAWGRDRGEALARLTRALTQSRVVVRDGTTNKAFLLDVLARRDVVDGTADVGWLDRLVSRGALVTTRGAEVALVRAAIEVYDNELDLERDRFFASAARGRPETSLEVGRVVELDYRGRAYRLGVRRIGPTRYALDVCGREIVVAVESTTGSPLRERRARGSEWRLTIGERTFRVFLVPQALGFVIDVDGLSHRIGRDSAGVVRATAPALVVSIAVTPGCEVAAGDRLLVVEAMKMEVAVRSPFAGRVREIAVAPGVQVSAGTALLVLEPLERSEPLLSAPQVDLESLAQAPSADPDERRARILAGLQGLMLGFDMDAPALQRILRERKELAADVFQPSPGWLVREEHVIEAFLDIFSLFQRPADDRDHAAQGPLGHEAYLFKYLQSLDASADGLPPLFLDALTRALSHYGVRGFEATPELREALFRIFRAHRREDDQITPVMGLLEWRLQHVDAMRPLVSEQFRSLLDRLIEATQHRHPSVNDLAREVRYRFYEQPLLERASRDVYAQAEAHLDALAADPLAPDRAERVDALVECPQPLATLCLGRLGSASPQMRQLMLEVMARRYYRIRDLQDVGAVEIGGHFFTCFRYDHDGRRLHVVTTYADTGSVEEVLGKARPLFDALPEDQVAVDLYVWHPDELPDPDATAERYRVLFSETAWPGPLRRFVVVLAGPHAGLGTGGMQHFTYRRSGDVFQEERFYRGAHPMMGKRLDLWRLRNFDIERLPSVEDVYLLHGVAKGNPRDERLFAVAEVRDLTPVRDEQGRIVQLPQLERMFMEAVAGIRHAQAQRPPDKRLHWNRMLLYVWPPFDLPPDQLQALVARLSSAAEGVGLEMVFIRARVPDAATGELVEKVIALSEGESGLTASFRPLRNAPIHPLSVYEQKVVRARQLGLTYPYELIRMLTAGRGNGRGAPGGEFFEHDLDDDLRLVPVNRPPGENRANVVVGVVRNFTQKYPEGMARVILLGDPTRELGSLAEPECRRIMAAIDLAEQKRVPIEWFALSAGAKIAMDTGTENMDWIALVLRRLVTFTQNGGEVNVIVSGINVGAQPYWNAEATMLMHTRGILVMMPESAMVLTGKRALDYSGGVSAEDNRGIGGFERVMGPNGEAQYFARDIREAARILLAHYDHTHIAPGELFPRRATTRDPIDRDVCLSPYGYDHHGFATVGDIFSDVKNPGRKKPFDIRQVMAAVVDQDHAPLERWADWRDAEMTVVWDCHLGGWPVELLGLESRPLQRFGFVPADGPDQWTAGTLFPQSSRKMARAVNAASGNRPVVILANLTGFDGSPESLRRWQLEYGAEIGRAVVNFRGPLVFCVISRYHGGAFVVFSNALNANLEVAALEGSYASVIGGAPAAAVVFQREVERRVAADPAIRDLENAIRDAPTAERGPLRVRLLELRRTVRAARIAEVADEFDRVHSVQRAQRVGSVHRIIAPGALRPYLVEAVERGMGRERERLGRDRVIARPQPAGTLVLAADGQRAAV